MATVGSVGIATHCSRCAQLNYNYILHSLGIAGPTCARQAHTVSREMNEFLASCDKSRWRIRPFCHGGDPLCTVYFLTFSKSDSYRGDCADFDVFPPLLTLEYGGS